MTQPNRLEDLNMWFISLGTEDTDEQVWGPKRSICELGTAMTPMNKFEDPNGRFTSACYLLDAIQVFAACKALAEQWRYRFPRRKRPIVDQWCQVFESARNGWLVLILVFDKQLSSPPVWWYVTKHLAGLAGFAYKFVVSAEHLSARSVALWQAASPLINFAPSEAG